MSDRIVKVYSDGVLTGCYRSLKEAMDSIPEDNKIPHTIEFEPQPQCSVDADFTFKPFTRLVGKNEFEAQS